MTHQLYSWVFVQDKWKHVQKNTGIFIVAPNWKQPRCPSVGEWIDKMICPHNRILLNTKMEQTTGTEKRWISHSAEQKSFTEENTYHVISLIRNSKTSNTYLCWKKAQNGVCLQVGRHGDWLGRAWGNWQGEGDVLYHEKGLGHAGECFYQNSLPVYWRFVCSIKCNFFPSILVNKYAEVSRGEMYWLSATWKKNDGEYIWDKHRMTVESRWV